MSAFLRITLILLFLSAALASDYDSVQMEHIQDRPDGFDLRIKTFGQEYNLKLKQQPSALSENLKILSINNGRVEETSYQGEIPKLFVDFETRTVLHVDKSEVNLKLEGVLSSDISLLPSQGIRSAEPAIAFRKTQKQTVFSCKDAPTPKMFTPQQYNRQAYLPVPNIVQPELLVIIDYKIFKQMDFNEDILVKYLSVMWTSVNRIFAQIKNPGIKLVVTKIFPIKDLKDQPFIENALYGNAYLYFLNATESLGAVNDYMLAKIKDDYDIGMLMTAEDLASFNASLGVFSRETAGIAAAGGVCSKDDSRNYQIGIGEVRFPYFNEQFVLAHELAHLLGAKHDGGGPLWPGHPGAADCSEDNGYLMSPTLSENTETMNYLRWSHCSVKQIHWFINQQTAMCLLNNPGSSKIDESPQLPGELISLDDQCQSLLGDSFQFCKQALVDVCSSLKCVSGNSKRNTRYPALEGSPCSETGIKWCRRGKCVDKKHFTEWISN